jgi:hypothetical protein
MRRNAGVGASSCRCHPRAAIMAWPSAKGAGPDLEAHRRLHGHRWCVVESRAHCRKSGKVAHEDRYTLLSQNENHRTARKDRYGRKLTRLEEIRDIKLYDTYDAGKSIPKRRSVEPNGRSKPCPERYTAKVLRQRHHHERERERPCGRCRSRGDMAENIGTGDAGKHPRPVGQEALAGSMVEILEVRFSPAGLKRPVGCSTECYYGPGCSGGRTPTSMR